MWEPFARVCPFPTHTYDLIGLGRGPRPQGRYALDMYAQQLAGVVGSEPVDVLGFSMGALVAQQFTLDFPHLVRRLVLVSGVFDRSAEERAAILSRVEEVIAGRYAESIEPALTRWFTADYAANNPDAVDRVRQRMHTNDVPAYAQAYRIFATGDVELTSRVDAISAPTLVITGEEDERSTPDMSRRLASRIPNAQLALIPGVKHLLPLEAPGQLAAVVTPFLAA
jgi:(E)-2-((N-methylformamido)methylene)succinate hydrolase